MYGAMISETIDISLMRMFIDGPDVSLKGSPTVSPVTDALCGSDPLKTVSPLMSTPFSKDFLALSHAPPAFDWKIPINTPDTVTPANRPPNTSGPNVKPTTTGVIKAMAPGIIISRREACVEIATHFSYSG